MNKRKQVDITIQLYSKYLKRYKTIDVILPYGYWDGDYEKYPVLYMNDGQDLTALRLIDTLSNLSSKNEIKKIIVIAIRANNRLYEYGTAGIPDYQNRGNEAQQYTDFLLEELMPLINRSYKVKEGKKHTTIMGFSLGGLSAFDIAWKHHEKFSKVGVFSGSFWWRSKSFNDNYEDDADRIMHQIVRDGEYKDGLKFWFEVGTLDEESDRNNNGVIDAIEDTLDIISELKEKGYTEDDISYNLIQGGQHNFYTWAHVFPEFLKWSYSK